VATTGAPRVSFQWQKDGADIPGARQSRYTIASVQPSDAGTYRCVVTTTLGSVVSDEATLALIVQKYPRIGDVNVDGAIEGYDATLIKYLSDWGEAGLAGHLAANGHAAADSRLADVNRDGRVELWDATLLYYTLLLGRDTVNAFLDSRGMPLCHVGDAYRD